MDTEHDLHGDSLRAGAGLGDITPPVGAELSGGAFGRSRAVLDPLRVKVLCLEDGAVRLALATFDLLGMDPALAADIRAAVAVACGVPPAAVMLACTHTHGGPASLSLRTWGRAHPGYAELLRRAAVGAATDAVAARRPARLGAGTTTCPGVAKNRTSYGNGLTDDTLGVLKVEDAAGRPLALVVNYACHPVNLHSSGMLTADYPARIESAVQASLRCDVPVLFLLAPCGDLNPANFTFDAHASQDTVLDRGMQAAEATGQRIADGVIDALGGIVAAPGASLGFAEEGVSVGLQPFPSRNDLDAIARDAHERMQRARDRAAAERAAEPLEDRLLRNWEYCEQKGTAEWACDALNALARGTARTAVDVRLSGLRLGPAVVIGVPGELFVTYGRQIRGTAGIAHTLVATNANGSLGYFPTPAAYAAGKYEALICPRWLGLQPFEPDCGERVCAGALRLRDRLAGVSTP